MIGNCSWWRTGRAVLAYGHDPRQSIGGGASSGGPYGMLVSFRIAASRVRQTRPKSPQKAERICRST